MKLFTITKAGFICSMLFLILAVESHSQESLVSFEEAYYDFLSLDGITERPALNYRTLSDSVWQIPVGQEHLWQKNHLGTFRPLFGTVKMKIFGPELYMSVNTESPYGQNDGLLWQGRGFNSSLRGGVKLEGYGVELTLLPHFAFSQNAEFSYITPNAYYSGTLYNGKADTYGYYGVASIDAPQRFGDEPLFDWSFGDSEIRYSWKTLTVGFGTQSIWLGPARINPIIHSNNAPSYPKLDLGLRRQAIRIPKLGWHIGDIEFRFWLGYLSESEWFDNDDTNDHNLISGLSLAYSFPAALKGLTLGFNRTLLSKWEDHNYASVLELIWLKMEHRYGFDENDQRASVTVDYLLPAAGMHLYFEWGRNDYNSHIDAVFRYPFHTEGWTFGVKKSVPIPQVDYLKGEILLEVSNIECSQDYDRLFDCYSTFYAHHLITQGYTNRGQWLGPGMGTGGNSQYLGFKLYFPRGSGSLFLQRNNPDLDYTWFIEKEEHNIRANLDIGSSGLFFITPSLSLQGSLVVRVEHNPLNKRNDETRNSALRCNAHLALAVKYSF